MSNKQAALTMTEALKAALRASGESTRATGRATGIPYPCLSRFLLGKQTLRLDAADGLAAYFGIGIVPPRRPAAAKPKPPNPRLSAALAQAAKAAAGRGRKPRKGGRGT